MFGQFFPNPSHPLKCSFCFSTNSLSASWDSPFESFSTFCNFWKSACFLSRIEELSLPLHSEIFRRQVWRVESPFFRYSHFSLTISFLHKNHCIEVKNFGSYCLHLDTLSVPWLVFCCMSWTLLSFLEHWKRTQVPKRLQCNSDPSTWQNTVFKLLCLDPIGTYLPLWDEHSYTISRQLWKFNEDLAKRKRIVLVLKFGALHHPLEHPLSYQLKIHYDCKTTFSHRLS